MFRPPVCSCAGGLMQVVERIYAVAVFGRSDGEVVGRLRPRPGPAGRVIARPGRSGAGSRSTTKAHRCHRARPSAVSSNRRPRSGVGSAGWLSARRTRPAATSARAGAVLVGQAAVGDGFAVAGLLAHGAPGVVQVVVLGGLAEVEDQAAEADQVEHLVDGPGPVRRPAGPQARARGSPPGPPGRAGGRFRRSWSRTPPGGREWWRGSGLRDHRCDSGSLGCGSGSAGSGRSGASYGLPDSAGPVGGVLACWWSRTG